MASEEVQSQNSLTSQIAVPEIFEPSTPTLQHASLPGRLASPGAAAALSNLQASRIEGAKPAPQPPVSSMTPPPSSQIPSMVRVARTPTPPALQLQMSSPPPTVVPQSRSRLLRSYNTLSTLEQVDVASSEELRRLVNELIPNLREARMSAAHHKLQLHMLTLESSEASKRMGVEMDM
ncbi:hypothetical protein LTR16_009713, partial [Cryomyces antarcticus]